MDRVEPIIYEVLGQPTAKGRARSVMRGKFIAHVTPEKTRVAENSFLAQSLAHKPPTPFVGPVKLSIAFIIAIPESKSKKWKGAAMEGSELPTKKPDIDNLAKLVLDSLNGVFWLDDKQVVALDLVKIYGAIPKTIVKVEVIA